MESNLKKKVNKVLSTAVVLSAVLAPSAALANAPFKDLNKAAAWAQGGILEAQSRGLLKGDEKGNFRPTALVTRQEVASILVNILKLEESNTQTSSYTDVPANAWGLKAIEAVKNAGIMRGDGNGKFRPNAPVTREELASVLVGAIKADTTGRGTNLNVADAAQISSWAKPAVEVAMEKGLLRGDGKNFNPKQKAPRQEVAIMAVNLANALNQAPTPTPTPTTPDTVEAKVEGVTDSAITLNGKSYNLASDVKGLFNAKNSEALKGATVKAEMKDGAVAKVTYLEVTAAGKAAKSGEKEFSGNVVLDGGVVNGNVKVKGDYVSFKNLTVKGDLEIAKEVENDFYSYNVKVDGKTYVNGGDSNTVVFEAGTLGAVEINKKGVRVEATGKTTLGNVTVSNNAVIVAESGVTIPKVTVQSGVSSIEVKATVTTLDITDKNTKVTVSEGASINNLVLPSGVRAEEMVNNYSQVKNRISKVNNSSSSTGGGGGGGGGGGSTTNDRTYSKNANVDLKNDTVNGNVTITAENFTLRNATIKGDLTMYANANVTLDNVTVQGKTILK